MKQRKMTKEEMKLFKKCDGKHKSLEELFACESCAILLNEEIA